MIQEARPEFLWVDAEVQVRRTRKAARTKRLQDKAERLGRVDERGLRRALNDSSVQISNCLEPLSRGRSMKFTALLQVERGEMSLEPQHIPKEPKRRP